MNISQKQAILTEIETIQGFDFDNMVIGQSPENTDISSVNFGKYTAPEFKSLLYRTVEQLKAELEKGLGLWLPNQERFHNDFGQVTLDVDILNLRNFLANISHKDEAAEILDRIIYYQIRQGFWDRSAVKVHDVDMAKINGIKNEVELIQKDLTTQLANFDQLKGQFESKIDEVTSFLIAKKEEMIVVNKLLDEASASNSRITEIAAVITNRETEIAGVLKNVTDKLTTVTGDISIYQTLFSSIEAEAAALKQKLEATLSTGLQDLEKARQGMDFIESNRADIVRLTGMAADGSLGSKFDQRQLTLADGLSFWKWGVPIVTVISILWVIAVFTWIPSHADNIWINLMVNLLKTSPSFILMGFVFSQYSKERNLQEEYAFKSAVAMTLTAYSTMLEKRDDEGNKTRQEMLLKSIQQVYLQPRIHADRKESIYSMNGKHLKEAIQTLSEAVKNIKN